MSFNGKHGPLLIAEIGGNHEGDFKYAKRLTELAIQTNVDFIKYQIYKGDSLVSKIEGEQRNRHFKKFELTKEQHLELANMVQNSGIGYMASVWDLDTIPWIDEFISIYKIGSGDLTAYPILEVISEIGKPIILSTGLSTEKEVLDSISFIQGINPIYHKADKLAILQCTSMYPINDSDVNLEVISTLLKKTGLTVGYSDHTEGTLALRYAAAMGAQVLEFHFTDTREEKTFRDHRVSLIPSEVVELIQEIKTIKLLKGVGLKQPLPIEIETGHTISFRRAVYLKHDTPAQQVLSLDDLVVLRPLVGIDAREYKSVVGRRLIKAKRAYERLDWDDLE